MFANLQLGQSRAEIFTDLTLSQAAIPLHVCFMTFRCGLLHSPHRINAATMIFHRQFYCVLYVVFFLPEICYFIKIPSKNKFI